MPDLSNPSLACAIAMTCVFSIAGCAGTVSAPALQTVRLKVDPSLLGPQPDSPVPAAPPHTEAAPPPPNVAAASPPEVTPEVTPPAKIAKPDPIVVTTPAPPPTKVAPRVANPAVAAPPVAIAVPAKIVVERPSVPALDVASLKARLKGSPAMGIFTKLALQNQMDDLIGRFRAHYRDKKATSVAYLRAPFDVLVAKVLTELQEGDPSLARTIGTSREAIWDILSDPVKFASVS